MSTSGCNSTVDLRGTRGWVKQSNDRGTWDIIVTCAITTFLCLWTAVSVNVPAPEHGLWDMFRDRIHMFCLGILAPEVLLALAVGQYCSAKDSVKAFAESKIPDWTLRHGFFADMGGIHLQIKETKSFPINAKQLHFLVTKHYIPYPDISLELISDKNKNDGLARFITTCQIGWFTLSTLSRPFKSYAVTTLELTTLGYIVCAIGMLFFWRRKPMDIQLPIILNCPLPLDQIIDDEGQSAADPYQFTPLDFVSRKEWIVTQLWTYYVNILRQMKIVHVRKRPLPLRKVSSFNFPQLPRPTVILLIISSFIYTSAFLAGWNLFFPAPTERLLWHIAAGGMIVAVFIGATLEFIFYIHGSREKRNLRQGVRNSDIELELAPEPRQRPLSRPKPLTRWERVKQKLRNNTPNQDPAYDLPLGLLVSITPLCTLYAIIRAFILVEDVISFRELPASAFVTIDWSAYVPHL